MAVQKRTRSRGTDSTRQAALASRRRRDQRRRLVAAVVASAVLVLGVTVLVGGGSDPDDSGATTTTIPGRKPAVLTAVSPGLAVTGETKCPAANGSSARTTSFARRPPMCIDPTRTYVAEMRTSKGIIVIDLDASRAPMTVNNFVVLARYHFYDDVPFHRVIPDFVIQVGDPEATGRGGPGYTFADELPGPGEYRVGSVAMANSVEPDSNGSQFFIITGADGVALAPEYSLFGQVTAGLEVAASIEAVGIPSVAGDPNSGRPTEVVTIESITIKET